MRQYFNLAYFTFLSTLPEPFLDSEHRRYEAVKQLAWPEDAEAMRLAEQSAITREAQVALGGGIDEGGYQRAWDERQAALAEVERRRAEAEQLAADAEAQDAEVIE